jgi:hypothetical protein
VGEQVLMPRVSCSSSTAARAAPQAQRAVTAAQQQDAEPKPPTSEEQQIGKHAVIELDRGHILEGREPGRRVAYSPGGTKPVAHRGQVG